MRCPVCGGLYIYHLENVLTCVEGHKWTWTDRGLVVVVPPPNRWITITVVRDPAEDESRWEGEGGR